VDPKTSESGGALFGLAQDALAVVPHNHEQYFVAKKPNTTPRKPRNTTLSLVKRL